MYFYIPMVIYQLQPELDLVDAWTSDSQEVEKYAFLAGEEMQYWVSGTNNFFDSTEVLIQWTLAGPNGQDVAVAWRFTHGAAPAARFASLDAAFAASPLRRRRSIGPEAGAAAASGPPGSAGDSGSRPTIGCVR